MIKPTRVQYAALSEQLPGLSVTFQAKPPHTRFDVVVSSPVGQDVDDELASALLGIGFYRAAPQPAHNGQVAHSFEREGYGMCGGWTATERDRLTRDARRALRRFGFTMVPEVRT